ncbi:MAG: TRAP transporter substrate-binding protein [Salinisphaera sp.]|uniref:TRAP transporter substrate-binding protein n=1 Tax=Salinisphaera sp. TaxID=1914330 RepID=UPI003C7DE888
MTIKRRDFLKTGAGALAGAASAPMIASAADKKTFHWRMTSAYSPGAPFYTTGPGSATDFCKRVEAASNGRLKIDFYAAKSLVPAFGGFDAVRSGTVQMNWGNSYFWSGKVFAAQYFAAVPFGMGALGVNAWLYNGGGIQLWDEIYSDFGLKALPCGNTGMQMTGWFKKPIENVGSFKGLRMRIPGLAAKVYEQLGVSVKLLPGSSIFPALNRGVIDAAEFVGPYLDRQLGLQNAAQYYYTPGWHEPGTVSELLIGKKAWESLPPDLQAIVENCAAACNEISFAWCNANNPDALRDLVDKQGVKVKQLPDGVLEQLRTASNDILSDYVKKDPQVAKVNKSYFDFKKKADAWFDISEKMVLDKNL